MSTIQKFSPLWNQSYSGIFVKKYRITCLSSFSSAPSTSTKEKEEEDEFRVLDFRGGKTSKTTRKRQAFRTILPPRTEKMPLDQDWTNVWPGPRTFHPASVPLPLHQGINKLGAAPDKVANIELMKIPNFLHLTPPAIKKHCLALRKFCSPWPKGLSTDAECQKHFPLEVIESDYCHASPSIRNPLSRIITIKFPLSRLELDDHAKDKFLRLVGERYDEATDIVTIVTDKCPLKKQNYDYALYLVTALYFESWNYEQWEKDKAQIDLEYFDWDNSKSKENVKYLLEATSRSLESEASAVTDYKKSVIALFDEGENDYNLKKYKESALKLLKPSS